MAEEKGFSSIVPEREERIGQRGTIADRKPTREREAANGGAGAGLKALVVVLLLAVAGIGWFGWQQYQQLTALQQNFDQLNEKLASTDESLSQSGTALQLKIKEQQDELTKHWTEIKKLWGISYDRNKKQIEGNKKLATDNAAKLNKMTGLAATVKSVSEQVALDSKKIADISGNSLAVNLELEELQERLQISADKLNTVEQSLKSWQGTVNARLQRNEEAVESIDTYRRQINQELLQLRKQLSGGAGS